MVTIEENVKIVKVGNSLRIATPVVFSKAPGILEGDPVYLERTDREILVRKLESTKPALSGRKGSATPPNIRAH